MSDDSPGVRIDIAHADLLYGLVRAQKPQRVLEFGFGRGRSYEAIWRAGDRNFGGADRPLHVIVDNWADWGGRQPSDAKITAKLPDGTTTGVEVVAMAECDFVAECQETFDFIMSDADHTNTHRWFEDVYDRLLAPGGILVYHDCRNFPGIALIAEACEREGFRHVVFDRSSVAGEACERGLLCIFKP